MQKLLKTALLKEQTLRHGDYSFPRGGDKLQSDQGRKRELAPVPDPRLLWNVNFCRRPRFGDRNGDPRHNARPIDTRFALSGEER